METNQMQGKQATLIEGYKGYFAIKLIEKNQFKWLVEIIGSGQQIEVYEDEFFLD